MARWLVPLALLVLSTPAMAETATRPGPQAECEASPAVRQVTAGRRGASVCYLAVLDPDRRGPRSRRQPADAVIATGVVLQVVSRPVRQVHVALVPAGDGAAAYASWQF